jgi:hypothetical protein
VIARIAGTLSIANTTSITSMTLKPQIKEGGGDMSPFTKKCSIWFEIVEPSF